jgi:hypothetical protein
MWGKIVDGIVWMTGLSTWELNNEIIHIAQTMSGVKEVISTGNQTCLPVSRPRGGFHVQTICPSSGEVGQQGMIEQLGSHHPGPLPVGSGEGVRC